MRSFGNSNAETSSPMKLKNNLEKFVKDKLKTCFLTVLKETIENVPERISAR